jgi:hypothetical protein
VNGGPILAERLRALREGGYRPVEVAPGRYLAICPACNQLDLVLGENSHLPATDAEKDIWLDARSREGDGHVSAPG